MPSDACSLLDIYDSKCMQSLYTIIENLCFPDEVPFSKHTDILDMYVCLLEIVMYKKCFIAKILHLYKDSSISKRFIGFLEKTGVYY